MRVSEKSFREWVDKHGDRQIAGECGNPYSCIVANYLMEVAGARAVEVTDYDYVLIFPGKHKGYQSPKWMENVINTFDKSGESEHSVTFGTFKKAMGW